MSAELLEVCKRFGVLDVVERVVFELGVAAEEMLGAGRSRTVVAARRRLCVLLCEAGLSYPEIGRCMGRDHSSIMYLVKTSPESVRARVA